MIKRIKRCSCSLFSPLIGHKILRIISLLALFLASIPVHAKVIFSDSFESQVLHESFESGDMSTTNLDGFSWGQNNRTSIVTINPKCGGLQPGDPTAIYNNGVICNGPISGRDWYAYRGDNSLRFRYPKGKNWAEQRFYLGKSYPELWISYWIRVPVNFSRGPGTNNKWFKIWMGDNSLYDDMRISEYIARDWPGTPSVNIDVDLVYQNGLGQQHSAGSYQNFVTPSDAGRWMHNIYYMKASSGGGVKDGRVAWYRKWEDESDYTTIADSGGIEMIISPTSRDAGYDGFNTGYILGWVNAPYTQDTEWLLDDFVISTSSPLLNSPNAITNIRIR